MKFDKTSIEPFALEGGLDLVSPAMALAPGNCIDALNYEPDINGGMRRMYGYERFSGRPSPSAASYYNCVVTITGSIAAGNTITGLSSGATAVVLQVNGTTELIVTKVVGTFTAESIQVAASTQGTIATISANAATTPILHATYLDLAAANYRADIAKPAGSGPIRGAVYYNGNFYCFRNNAGGSACVMFKSSSTGWQAITFGRELQFSGAVGQINEGDIVTGAISGATGTVKRALLRTGTWASNGVGTLVFTTITGAFQNAEAIQVSTVTKVTSVGVDTAISLSPGGKFEFVTNNFSGTLATFRLYGCDGVNFAFEWDGTTFVPIRTGINPDAPKFITAWKNMLVVGLASSVQVSGIGQPFSWTALTGAAELALGDTCTGLLPQIGSATQGALVIGTTSKTFILYGNTTADFNLVTQSPDSGPQPYTLQNIGYAYFLDTKGVLQINTTRAFGNFEMSTLTRKIQPLIDLKRGLVTASCVVRATNQYRIFYSDGTGIILYMVAGQSEKQGDQSADVAAIMFFDYGSSVYMNTVSSAIDSNGIERTICGGSDGYVYELERGASFDGAVIPSHLVLAFNSDKTPRNRKHYKRTVIGATCQNTAQVTIGYELNYGSTETDSGYRGSQTLLGAGGYWDVFTWDSFSWDAPYLYEYTVDTPGDGLNIGMIIYGSTAIDYPYTLHACTLHYTVRRLDR